MMEGGQVDHTTWGMGRSRGVSKSKPFLPGTFVLLTPSSVEELEENVCGKTFLRSNGALPVVICQPVVRFLALRLLKRHATLDEELQLVLSDEPLGHLLSWRWFWNQKKSSLCASQRSRGHPWLYYTVMREAAFHVCSVKRRCMLVSGNAFFKEYWNSVWDTAAAVKTGT